jgi:hypothetical protein
VIEEIVVVERCEGREGRMILLRPPELWLWARKLGRALVSSRALGSPGSASSCSRSPGSLGSLDSSCSHGRKGVA